MGQLEEALKVLTAYTSKLEEEAEQRQENSKLLDVFTWQQQHLLYEANLKQKVQWLSSLQCLDLPWPPIHIVQPYENNYRSFGNFRVQIFLCKIFLIFLWIVASHDN